MKIRGRHLEVFAAATVFAMTLIAAEVHPARATEVEPTRERANAVTVQRPWAATAEMGFHLGEPGYASIGVGFARAFKRHLRADAGIGYGLPSTVATAKGTVHVEPVVDAGLRVRITLPIDILEKHALFLGVGPHFSTGGAYDNLWRGRMEVGYELRAQSGPVLLYGIGPQVVLNARPAAVSPSDCVTSSCAGALASGAVSLVIRAGLGWSF